ncbi:membrane protein [Sporosarcina globispora]|uniref:Membrane protein n=1 Tax=Sporosarcina globispora TaxID=1459 RepID=A0A0M0GHN2_SPOGL|nr:NfeD family protein [Sporosarcina globispora]KON89364.1 membrane protein [Sporosarcina globispora]
MELFGLPIQTIYLSTLIFSGILIILYVLFGDNADGFGESGFLNPVLILAFFTFVSASGYILEITTDLNSLVIFMIGAGIALLLDILLNVFVLIPLSAAEESLVYTDESLRGRVGTVLIPIPENGFGEVLIENISGRISKPALSHENTSIAEGSKVLIVDVEHGVIKVIDYEEL